MSVSCSEWAFGKHGGVFFREFNFHVIRIQWSHWTFAVFDNCFYVALPFKANRLLFTWRFGQSKSFCIEGLRSRPAPYISATAIIISYSRKKVIILSSCSFFTKWASLFMEYSRKKSRSTLEIENSSGIAFFSQAFFLFFLLRNILSSGISHYS